MNFLFYDLETSGRNKQFDQIFQFAAILTDNKFNQIDEPVEYFCKLRSDVLPEPGAIKVNQIDVRELDEKALCEFEFARLVEETLLGNGNQCVIGYNSMSFDDEFIRFLLYRNLLPAYDWSWRKGNSCFDLFSVFCLGYSFGRLSEIHVDEGPGSLKLENLSKNNNLTHDQAHDAVSDVKATIELARLLREKCPKLLEYALSLSDRAKVRRIITANDLFCSSAGVYGYAENLLALHTQICDHPTNRNSVIGWNLKCDPTDIFGLTVNEIQERMYAKGEDRTIEVGFEDFKTNKSPMVTVFANKASESLRNYDLCLRNLEAVKANLPKLKSLAREIFTSEIPPKDLDADLYIGYFEDVGRDEKQLVKFRNDPANFKPMDFTVKRFQRQLRRLQARNFPEMLSASENEKYLHWRDTQRLSANALDGCVTWTEFEQEFVKEIADFEITENQRQCLLSLREHLSKTHDRELIF